MKLSFDSASPNYTIIGRENNSWSSRKFASSYRYIIGVVLVVCTLLTTLLIGIFIGKTVPKGPNSLIAGSLSARTFKYNRDFSYPPSNITNAAWQTLFPARGGFFTHTPSITQRTTLSVFHQLHCLDGIRHAYWQLHDAAIEGVKLSDEDFESMTSPSHIRHCVDLLRQSLMCAADQTLEERDEKGGVSGFGTVHQCVDYTKLVETIESWQQEA